MTPPSGICNVIKKNAQQVPGGMSGLGTDGAITGIRFRGRLEEVVAHAGSTVCVLLVKNLIYLV